MVCSLLDKDVATDFRVGDRRNQRRNKILLNAGRGGDGWRATLTIPHLFNAGRHTKNKIVISRISTTGQLNGCSLISKLCDTGSPAGVYRLYEQQLYFMRTAAG